MRDLLNALRGVSRSATRGREGKGEREGRGSEVTRVRLWAERRREDRGRALMEDEREREREEREMLSLAPTSSLSRTD